MASILPPHLSELERDLDAAMARLAAIDIPISTLWNPHTCPVEVLPYLAWAMSVDTWRSDWPELIKRQVIAAAPDVHRIKGTRPALEMALAALNIDAELTEWWETAPAGPPGTFEIIAWVNENLTPKEQGFLNQVLYAQIDEAINNTKNARSHYTVKVGAKFADMPLAVGVNTGLSSFTRTAAETIQQPLAIAQTMGVATRSTRKEFGRVTAEVRLDAAPPKPAALAAAVVTRAAQFIEISMEVTT